MLNLKPILSLITMITACYSLPVLGATSLEGATVINQQQLKQDLGNVGAARFTHSDYKKGPLRHIVLFRYKPSVSAEQRQEVSKRFLALSKSLRNNKPYIVSIEEGLQNSGEGADHGFEQAFLVTFNSEGDRNFYVGEPIVTDTQYFDLAHQDFKVFVGPLLAPQGALVFDYVINGKTK
ncbi:Dabb family protein [Iodobacter ciconiae]|uniref:Dabb family protein n=1 Tax=Iodobacter ciconiae TaxID=2496266 RepID=A0A3S8ZWX6_9NEIS|nr:Dabb family protein [Iodobacter ciconiae]AZN37972.1 Dabb family protein [Iodobacter ciconiae]